MVSRCGGVRLPEEPPIRHGEVIERGCVAVAPVLRSGSKRDAVAVALGAVGEAKLPPGMTHPARTHRGAGVAEYPVALRPSVACRHVERRPRRKVAVSVVGRVACFGREFFASETDPQRSVSIGTGQGKASRDKGPCPLPLVEDGQGPRCLYRVPWPPVSCIHEVTVTTRSDGSPPIIRAPFVSG